MPKCQFTSDMHVWINLGFYARPQLDTDPPAIRFDQPSRQKTRLAGIPEMNLLIADNRAAIAQLATGKPLLLANRTQQACQFVATQAARSNSSR